MTEENKEIEEKRKVQNAKAIVKNTALLQQYR